MNRHTNVLTAIFFVLLGLTVLYAVMGELLLPNENDKSHQFFEYYEEDWYALNSDNTMELVEIPGRVNLRTENECAITKQLPSLIREDAYLIVRSSKQDIEVYVDGVLRVSYSTKDTRLFGKASPTYYVLVKLYPEDSNKTVLVAYESDTRYAGVVSEIYYANYSGFIEFMFRTQGNVFVVSAIMFVIGLLALIMGVGLSFVYQRQQKLISISIGVLVVAFWMFCNSMFRQFIFPNVSVVGDLTFLMVAMLPYPFAVYINRIQDGRYVKAYFTVEVLCIIDIIVSIILYITGVHDFSESFFAMALVLLMLLVLMVVTVIIDVVKGTVKGYLASAIAIFLAGLVMVTEVYIYLRTDKTFDVSLAAVGLIIILIVAIADTIKDVYRTRQERQRAIMENEAKSEFLAKMSHEIRTPINAVLGMDTMILRESKDEQILEYAHGINNAGKNLLTIVNDILDFSKIASGKLNIVDVEYDFSSMINDVVNMIRPKTLDKGLIFETEIDGTIPRGYIGDDIRIKQILINLLTNAVKYTHEGRVTVSVGLAGFADNGDAILEFSVKDTGIGIKPEHLSKLTEEFVRIEESRNRNIEGTGLGMSIVSSLLKLMGTKLEVESKYGEGSDFHFKLQQKIVDSEPIGDISARMQQSFAESEYVVSFCIPDARLLVVDDNEMNRAVFKGLLKELRCQIDEADSGFACLELIDTIKYDIIFMDHMMPEMDGIETYRIMKDKGEYLNSETPVVILTANAINGAREQYLAQGFNDYVSKPIDAEQLDKVIASLIPENKKESVAKRQSTQSKQTSVEELPFVDGVDWNVALSKVNSEDLLRTFVKRFFTTADIEIDKLQSLYEELQNHPDQFAEFRTKAHSMKSNAATIGALSVSALAKYLEYAARDEDKTTIDNIFPLFVREWKLLVEAIDEGFGYTKELKQNQNEAKEVIDGEALREYLSDLGRAMDKLDINKADEIIDELRKYSYSSQEKGLLDKLAGHVMNFDSAACEQVIQEWEMLIK